MQTLTVNIQDDIVLDKVISLLEPLKNDGVEIVSQEDLSDLKLLKATRDEETISLESYLNNKH